MIIESLKIEEQKNDINASTNSVISKIKEILDLDEYNIFNTKSVKKLEKENKLVNHQIEKLLELQQTAKDQVQQFNSKYQSLLSKNEQLITELQQVI